MASYRKNDVAQYLENILLLLLGILLLGFPLIFTSLTTDAFGLPKQILLGIVVLLGLPLLGARMLSVGQVTVRKTPFDLPIFLMTIIFFVSAVLSINRLDALISFAPLLFAVFIFFLITNVAKNAASTLFLVSALTVGGVITSVITLLSYFKVYLFPFEFAKIQTFTPMGSLFDQAIYLVLLLPIVIAFAWPRRQQIDAPVNSTRMILFAVAAVILTAGVAVSVYETITIQKAFILPFETGFQTAFAAISQDAGRIAQGFFFGSGYGTYFTDFSRFKSATFNLNPELWSLTFFRSSSFVLELLATTGFLGILSFLFLIAKVISSIRHHGLTVLNAGFPKGNPLVISLILLLAASFILPFSFTTVSLLFFLLAIFASQQGLLDPKRFFDIELYFGARKHGVFGFAASPVDENGVATQQAAREEQALTKFLPITFFVIFLLVTLGLGFWSVRYAIADTQFQSSLVSATKNDGLGAYNSQIRAIENFPFRDGYYRVYSQLNLNLANSLAANQPQGSSPSAETQQIITTLIQQSINSARQATIISPLNPLNWQNLSSIYRALIGFGQNAESFAVASSQQAIATDPTNPQEYINLGGIYYQLQQWDDAQNQFQIAIRLKPDLANAYYNLGHALEQKGDLQNALIQYQTVKTLVANDKVAVKKIDEEIAVIQGKIGSAGTAQGADVTPTDNQPPLGISQPSKQLPSQRQQVEIPAPPTASESGRR